LLVNRNAQFFDCGLVEFPNVGSRNANAENNQ